VSKHTRPASGTPRRGRLANGGGGRTAGVPLGVMRLKPFPATIESPSDSLL
jgi:hypothetical protein